MRIIWWLCTVPSVDLRCKDCLSFLRVAATATTRPRPRPDHPIDKLILNARRRRDGVVTNLVNLVSLVSLVSLVDPALLLLLGHHPAPPGSSQTRYDCVEQAVE